MDVAHSRSLGFAGKEILFRKIEFERYRKPHVVEYPRSAIVLNPQHTRQLKDSLQHHHTRHSSEEGEDETDSEGRRGTSDSDDDDDPRRIDKSTQLCSDAQFRGVLHLRWQNITPVGLGLVNLGNTCFANSVLQALAHVPALAQYFMATFRSADNQLGAPFDFAFALAETFRKMHHAAQPGRAGGHSIAGAYRPGQIMSNLRLLSKHFSIGRQSDAHEFAVQLLFACQKSLLHRLVGSKKVQPRVSYTTALYRICGGYLLSQVTWSRQEEIQQLLRAGKQQAAMDLKMEAKQTRHQDSAHKLRASRHGLDPQTLCSNTYDPFTILSVELAGHTLQHCLDKFCLAEELEGRCYYSPREVGVRAKKKFNIHVPPPVLMIHLKRFGPTGNKINRHVQFPLELDISRYCTPLPSSSAKPPPLTGASGPPAGRDTREDCQYELNAVCVHEGSSLNYGHYYTMAKAANGMWYEFNDSHVSRLSEEQLQRAQAYILCYSRIPAKKKTAAAERPPSMRESDDVSSSTLPLNGRASSWANGVTETAENAMEGGVGRELTDAELQVLLEKRHHDASAKSNGTSAEQAALPKKNASQPATGRAHTFKRMREDLPTDSDSDGDGNESRNGAYVGRLRPAPGQRQSADLLQRKNTTDDENDDDDDASAQELNHAAPASAERSEASTNAATAKSLMYGGLIKSMKRIPHGTDATNNNDAGERAAHPNFRVGRHAVNALHARKTHSTPDTVKRPATAPKFQQRIRDPMWEMEMDRGKVKKVKSKEKAPDRFEGVNPFQEVSRGMFDIRGRRRSD